MLPFVANDYLVATGLSLLMWLALTQSWCVLSKMTGYVSLGHVVFYGLGAYLVVVTWQHWPLALAVPAAGVVAALFAALVGLPVLRVRGPYFVILTFGLAELVRYAPGRLRGGERHGESHPVRRPRPRRHLLRDVCAGRWRDCAAGAGRALALRPRSALAA